MRGEAVIDPTVEHTFSLTQATREYPFPRRRAGKRVNVSTLFRWAATGLHGVRLETIQIGGAKCTSREALGRFFDRLTHHGDEKRQETRSAQANRREREIQEAEERCKAAGI